MAIPRAGNNLPNGYQRPDTFSTRVLEPFYRETVVKNIASTIYMGELKAKHGEKIHIPKRPAVFYQDAVNGDPSMWEDVIDEETTLTLDYLKRLQVKISKIDKNRANINYMSEVEAEAKEQAKKVVESTIIGSVYSSAIESWDSGNSWATAGNAIGDIFDGAAKLTTRDVPQMGRFLLLHPMAAAKAMKEQALWSQNSGDAKSPLRTGSIGKLLDGTDVYVSAYVTGSGTNGAEYNCMMGHRSAIDYGIVMDNVTYFDKMETFPDHEAISATLLFGFGVTRDYALLHMKVQVA